ncbi:hypothetical protein QBC42DRAFT_282309 [Cladorrhinum samala]|uniref:Protein kinase domain-containing protein n=1 Tax=Cladorrhinum samala TaxID=585594 RepID=A0AAV9I380_9PEZI|nr:hypothetical protein QBC42DRAFT_282309 [Cladorrhinum samala]
MPQHEAVQHLQAEIRSRTRTNMDSHDFVPYSWLVELLGPDEIKKVLKAGSIEDHEQHPLAHRVRDSGLMTFATLVMIGQPDLVRAFYEEDAGVTKSGPDSKLPFKETDLPSALSEHAGEFCKTQYTFYVPMFPQGVPHRTYQPEIQLPFLKESSETSSSQPNPEKPKTGNFGIVVGARLPPTRYGDPESQGPTLVRKILKSRCSSSTNPGLKSEIRCLRLLNQTAHPSILHLLGSYTQSLTHTFLFPKAAYSDLSSLLRLPRASPSCPPPFRQHTSPPPFETILHSLTGLTSALSTLHSFTSDDLNLSLLGCHHDLKPANVLVTSEGKFLLADFGLSRIGSSVEEIEDTRANRDAIYEAPERRDYETAGAPIRGSGREADIWSLGGIFAVVLAWVKGGPDEVENFGERRKTKVKVNGGRITVVKRAFHDGTGGVNPGVVEWLEGKGWLGESDRVVSETEREFLRLIRSMLRIEPAERPFVVEVLRGLRVVAVKKVAEPIEEQLKSLPAEEGGKEWLEERSSRRSMRLEYAVERQVFLEWLARIDRLSATPGRQFLDSDAGFAQVYETVCEIREEFRLLTEAAREDTPLFARLRRLNSELLAWLSSGARKSVRTTAELKVMPRVREIYHDTQDAAKEAQPLVVETGDTEAAKLVDNVKVLLCAANVAKLMARSGSSVPRIDLKNLKGLSRKMAEGAWDDAETVEEARTEEDTDATGSVVSLSSNEDDLSDCEPEEQQPSDQEEQESREVRSFRLAELDEVENNIPIKTPVIVEELEIARDDYNNSDMSERLFSSIESVLSLPPSQASRFGALNCAGICHDIEQMHIKLLYRYPRTPDAADPSRRPRVRHLAEILGLFEGVPVNDNLGLYISIDERLRLARDLAAAVFEFHKIRWWHKSISCYNVLLFFFDNTALPPSLAVRKPLCPRFRKLNLGRPYLIGFSHSRPENAGYSNKMHAKAAVFPYHHPDYPGADAVGAETSPGYLAEYDYYSLGLVLLEIGMWQRLRRIFPDRNLTRHDMRVDILANLVPVLEGTLGSSYSEAVRACLSGELSGKGGDLDPASVDERFERMVLRPLEALQGRFDHEGRSLVRCFSQRWDESIFRAVAGFLELIARANEKPLSPGAIGNVLLSRMGLLDALDLSPLLYDLRQTFRVAMGC